MENVALVVHACDRYKLLYPGFEYFFKKHWPYKQLGISYYFFTEDIDYQSDVFTNIKTGKGEWSDRLLRGLQQIPQSHIIYMQEDMWLNKPVDFDTLEKIVQYVSNCQVNLLKLSSNPVYCTKSLQYNINGLVLAMLDNDRSRYLMSHQISVWKKSFLCDQLQYKEHPWRNEREGTKRLRKLNPKILQIDLFAENGNHPLNPNTDTGICSAYFTVSANASLNSFAQPYIDEMLRDDATPTIQLYAAILNRHQQQNLTHDGQPKPRKDDIFKKLKKHLGRLRR